MSFSFLRLVGRFDNAVSIYVAGQQSRVSTFLSHRLSVFTTYLLNSLIEKNILHLTTGSTLGRGASSITEIDDLFDDADEDYEKEESEEHTEPKSEEENSEEKILTVDTPTGARAVNHESEEDNTPKSEEENSEEIVFTADTPAPADNHDPSKEQETLGSEKGGKEDDDSDYAVDGDKGEEQDDDDDDSDYAVGACPLVSQSVTHTKPGFELPVGSASLTSEPLGVSVSIEETSHSSCDQSLDGQNPAASTRTRGMSFSSEDSSGVCTGDDMLKKHNVASSGLWRLCCLLIFLLLGGSAFLLSSDQFAGFHGTVIPPSFIIKEIKKIGGIENSSENKQEKTVEVEVAQGGAGLPRSWACKLPLSSHVHPHCFVHKKNPTVDVNDLLWTMFE